MAVEARPELVGKRFLCVSGDEPPENGDIVRLPWRSGVIRAVSNGDSANSDLTGNGHWEGSVTGQRAELTTA
ncbi:putative JmjC domain-containing histone demethylation protein 2C [Ilyodon furcidens]|uniref:JmjC domain-containing histone demethylation protein 2C n=1 Tax=Ilyodon furcidens TaxID=33524 RepID=A0ABV0TSM2_9TELE